MWAFPNALVKSGAEPSTQAIFILTRATRGHVFVYVDRFEIFNQSGICLRNFRSALDKHVPETVCIVNWHRKMLKR